MPEDRELLIRLDERTQSMAKDVGKINGHLESIDETLAQCIKPKLAEHDKEIALLKHNWKMVVGGLAIAIPILTFIMEKVIG